MSEGSLQLARGLSDPELEAVADLEQRVLALDGGRLKLEWNTLRTRKGIEIEDLLWWEDDRLVGFCGLYAFGPPSLELVGMVDPDRRRHGIGTALLDAALPVARGRGFDPVLLVVPRESAGGRALAERRGATVEHSEHALVLDGVPQASPRDPEISLRSATAADAPRLSSLLAAGFGHAPDDLAADMANDTGSTIVVMRGGDTVGTLRLSHDGDVAGIYGFVVDPALQGRGIGREVLGRVCAQLQEEGARQVRLEVAVDNDRALGLYTSLGFTRTQTEDYYQLPAP
jgi:ribosomal protein S18 acetylase RimI-like enzyme